MNRKKGWIKINLWCSVYWFDPLYTRNLLFYFKSNIWKIKKNFSIFSCLTGRLSRKKKNFNSWKMNCGNINCWNLANYEWRLFFWIAGMHYKVFSKFKNGYHILSESTSKVFFIINVWSCFNQACRIKKIN